VLIHNPIDISRLSNHYFRVPLGIAAVAIIEPKVVTTSPAVKKFSPSKRKCYLRNERILTHFKLFSQLNCLLECLSNYTLNKCRYVSYFMPSKFHSLLGDNATPVCGIRNIDCVYVADKVLNKDLKSKISGKGDEPHCDCRPSCTELSYNVETSHSDFLWTFGAPSDVQNIPDKLKLFVLCFSSVFPILTIYFKAEHFMGIERNELYGVSDLISNFGGLLGLFTGFSLISLAEIIYFLTLRIFTI
ncbi:ASC domain containing protein, partial [Asbolus verrucosus]